MLGHMHFGNWNVHACTLSAFSKKNITKMGNKTSSRYYSWMWILQNDWHLHFKSTQFLTGTSFMMFEQQEKNKNQLKYLIKVHFILTQIHLTIKYYHIDIQQAYWKNSTTATHQFRSKHQTKWFLYLVEMSRYVNIELNNNRYISIWQQALRGKKKTSDKRGNHSKQMPIDQLSHGKCKYSIYFGHNVKCTFGMRSWYWHGNCLTRLLLYFPVIFLQWQKFFYIEFLRTEIVGHTFYKLIFAK